MHTAGSIAFATTVLWQVVRADSTTDDGSGTGLDVDPLLLATKLLIAVVAVMNMATLAMFLRTYHRRNSSGFAANDTAVGKKEKTREVEISMNVLSTSTNYDNNTAMMTQMVTVHEMSIPGFLLVQLGKDVQLNDKIAVGGGGEVHLATATEPGLIERAGNPRIVAKTVHINPMYRKEQEAQFYQEISLMYLLRDSLHFAKIIGFCDNPLTILMKFYPYGSMDRLIAGSAKGRMAKVPYSKRTIVRLIHDLASAIAAMHRYGVVHSDVKPPNVLLDLDSNGNVHGLLADMGIARVVDETKALVQGFKWSQMSGISVMYASPQQWMDASQNTELNKAADVAKSSDVYAVGVVVCETLCRRLKF